MVPAPEIGGAFKGLRLCIVLVEETVDDGSDHNSPSRNDRLWRDSEVSDCGQYVRFLRYIGPVWQAGETSKMTLCGSSAHATKTLSEHNPGYEATSLGAAKSPPIDMRCQKGPQA